MRQLLLIKLMLCTLLLFNCNVDAQSVKFNKSYAPYNVASKIQDIFAIDTNYIAVGVSVFNYPQSILFMQLDEYGSTLSTKVFGDSNMVYYSGFEENMKRWNNNYIQIIERRDFSDTLFGKNAVLVKYNNIDSIWLKLLYNDSMSLGSYDCVVLDNNIYTIGLKAYDIDDADHYDIIVLKSDTAGNLKWINNYGSISMDWGIKISKTYDDKLMIASMRCGYYTSNNPWYNNDCQWWVFKLDTAGTMLWNRNYGHPDIRDGRPFGLIETSDTCYIVTGSLAIEMPDASERLRGRILKIDRNENIVWDRLYGNKTLETYVGITKEKSNTNLISIVNDGIPNYGYFMVIQELTSKGDIRWFRKYKYSPDPYGYSVLNSFDFTPDGGYIFAGYGTDTDSVPSQRSWVIKTDSLGFDGTYWQGDSTLGVSMVNDTVCYSDSALVHFYITGKSAPYSLLLSNSNSSDSIFYSPYFEPYAFDSLYIYPTDSNLWHSFSATVTDPWGNTVTENYSVFVEGCGTNIDELYGDSIIFNIFPNPSDGNFYAEVSCQRGSQGLTQSQTLTGKRGVEIQVTGLNSHHKTTIPVVSEKTLINTTGWAKGTYVCNLIIDGKVVRSEKLVLK